MLAPTLQYRLFIMTAKKPVKKWERFWRLTATWIAERVYVWYSEKNKYVRKEECICDCWNIVYISRGKLRHWETKSCWCLQKDITIKRSTIHWDRHTRFYKTRAGIKQRCLNSNDKSYKDYWWRGITLCNERYDYENFKKDMFDKYKEFCKIYWEKNITIDRIDVNWNYCKENCRWATKITQANNKRSTIHIKYKGKNYSSLSSLCRELGFDNCKYELIRVKLKNWINIDDVIGYYLSRNMS